MRYIYYSLRYIAVAEAVASERSGETPCLPTHCHCHGSALSPPPASLIAPSSLLDPAAHCLAARPGRCLVLGVAIRYGPAVRTVLQRQVIAATAAAPLYFPLLLLLIRLRRRRRHG